MQNKNLDDAVAFHIGEDLAYHRLPLPSDATKAMRDGVKAERIRRRSTRTADRFTRKWLQLRIGAWRRNRVFNSDITPEYLRSIDQSTCPVSGVEMTHGEQLDTDWSVDRLNNDGAYGRFNIAVMSTRVNRLKGSLTPEEIAEIALRNEDFGGMSANEWKKLAFLCGGLLSNAKTLVRFCAVPLSNDRAVSMHTSSYMQQWMVDVTKESKRRRESLWTALRSYCNDEAASLLQALRAFVERYASARPAHERKADELFADERAWELFCLWHKAFVASPTSDQWFARLMQSLQQAGANVMRIDDLEKDLAVTNRGYR